MQMLFMHGAGLAIGLIIGLIFTIVGAFIGHIILFDSILFSAIGGIVCNQVWKIHPALCVVIAIALFAFLFWLQNTKIGFWIIGTLLSLFWATVFGFIAYVITEKDMTWVYIIGAIGFIIMIGLHIKAKK